MIASTKSVRQYNVTSFARFEYLKPPEPRFGVEPRVAIPIFDFAHLQLIYLNLIGGR